MNFVCFILHTIYPGLFVGQFGCANVAGISISVKNFQQYSFSGVGVVAWISAVTSCEGRYGGVCRQEHRVEGHGSGWEKQKSIRLRLQPRKTSVWTSEVKGRGQNFGQTICVMCKQYYRYCVECLWVDTTKCIKKVKCMKPPKKVTWTHYRVYLIHDLCCKCQSFIEASLE